MGIGDFGIGHGGSAYTYNTTEFLGNFSWNSVYFYGGTSPDISVQLNVVLSFIQSGVTYAYWIQDVAFLVTGPPGFAPELSFENNIWNLTVANHCLSNSAVSGANGTVYPVPGGSSCEGYYAASSTNQPGAYRQMPSPGDLSLLVRSYYAPNGTPEVAFEYWDGVTSWFVTYDNVVWPWATHITSDRNFVVDGNEYAPSGNFYDAELTIGGPGGGTTTAAKNLTLTGMELLYWNGFNFEAPQSAWNFGGNTQETTSNIQSIWNSATLGIPVTTQLNGTTLDATPSHVYDQTQVGYLDIPSTGVADGTVAVGSEDWQFVGGQAYLTLDPGLYPTWINSTGSAHDLGLCAITAGTTLTVSSTTGCTPIVSKPVGSPPGLDLGQSTVITASVVDSGSGGDTFAWSVSPVGLGCASSSNDSLPCHPTAPGTYEVNVTIRDSLGRSFSSPDLSFVVDVDPIVGTPVPSRATVETGALVSFSAATTGGAPPFNFAWSGLPGPCTRVNSSDPTCRPVFVGNYSVSVIATDANSFSATSGVIEFPVTQGPTISVSSDRRSSSVDAGQGFSLTATAANGSGGYTYQWTGIPGGCSSPYASNASLSCDANTSGTYFITATVTDSNGGTATSAPLYLEIDPELGVALTVARPTIDLGVVTTLIASVYLGSGGVSYLWKSLPPGCTSVDNRTLNCVPTATGPYIVDVNVTDSNGENASAQTVLTIVPDPVLTLTTSSLTILEGASTTFDVSVGGGVGPMSYVFTGLPAGCSAPVAESSSGFFFSCTPSVTGSFTVRLSVVDSQNLSATSSIVLTVSPSFLGLPAVEGLFLVGVPIGLAVALGVILAVRRRRRARGREPPVRIGQLGPLP
jgi:hypothetical protein